MMPRSDAPSPDTIAAKKMHAVQEDIFTRYLIACDTTKDLKTLDRRRGRPPIGLRPPAAG